MGTFTRCGIRRPFEFVFSAIFTRRSGLTVCVFLILLTIIWAGWQTARAASGDLDPSFGSAGKVVTDLAGGSNDFGNSIAIQPDGKIVVAGRSGVYPLFHSALARYNTDGSLDQSFGTGGKTVIEMDANGDLLSAVVIQPDGKILAAGSFNQTGLDLNFMLARFNADGSLDSRFGAGGRTLVDFGDRTAEVGSLLLQPDGKIIIAGSSGGGFGNEFNDFALARFNANGRLDLNFGADGKLKTHFEGGPNSGTWGAAGVLQRDGKIVVAGSYKTDGMTREFALARYNADGSLDQSFGLGGEVTTFFDRDVHGNAVALQRDGKIVVGGHLITGFYQNNEFALARYDANGNIDPSFGTGGRVVKDLFDRTNDIIYSLSVQKDGKLVAVGRTGNGVSMRFGIARFLSNGEYDTVFGNNGRVLTDFNGTVSEPFSAALQRDGRIVVAGYSGQLNAKDFTLARYIGVQRGIQLDSGGEEDTTGLPGRSRRDH